MEGWEGNRRGWNFGVEARQWRRKPGGFEGKKRGYEATNVGFTRLNKD